MQLHTDISNTADVIDSRDIIARIAELETERDESPEDFTDGDRAELAALAALADEGETCPDWTYGETLVHESYFEEYAQELADDIGAIPRDAGWPLGYIDWKAAADALLMDYTSLDYDGVTYYARA